MPAGCSDYFGSVSGEEAGDSVFMVEEGPAQGLGLTGAHLQRIDNYGSSSGDGDHDPPSARLDPLSRSIHERQRTQPEKSWGITTVLTISSTAGPWTGPRNDSLNVLVDSKGAWRHCFDNVSIPRLQDRLERYRVLDGPQKL